MNITEDTTLEDLSRWFYGVLCRDCGVKIGEKHLVPCTVARCDIHGQQMWSCDHEWTPDTWTGFWPGVLDCVEQGLFCYFGPDYGEIGWIQCDESDPRAQPDLNRLAIQI